MLQAPAESAARGSLDSGFASIEAKLRVQVFDIPFFSGVR
jgi:hypothetical protein